MVAGPAANHAAALARRMPRLRVGLHLVLADGVPTLPPAEIPALVDRRGLLNPNMAATALKLVVSAAARRQLRREIRAQFEAFGRTGLALDHVNAHKHFHVHPLIAGELFAIGREYGMRAMRIPCEPADASGEPDWPEPLPVRLMTPWARRLGYRAARVGLRTPDAVFGLRWSGAMTAERLSRLVRRLPGGLVEIYLHPATADSFTGHVPGYRYADELAALGDPDVIALLGRSDRRLGGYGDMAGDADPGLFDPIEARRR